MLKQKQIQLLEDYHRGLLSLQERQEVEQTILADKELGAEATAYFELLDGFKGLELEAFGLSLHSWESKYKEELVSVASPNTPKVFTLTGFVAKYRLAIAAVILVMLMPLGYYMIQGNASQNDLFASNFEPYKPIIDTKTRAPQPTNSADPLEAERIARGMFLSEGIDAYNEKNYEKAIKNLSQFILVATKEDNLDEVRIYLGVSNLIENNTTTAKALFKEVNENGKTKMYIDASQWYMALSLLKEKDIASSRKILRKIAHAKKHRYKTQAAKLLPKLEQYK